MNPESIALVDMDGTLCDFDKSMKEKLESLRSPDEDPTLDETAYEEVPHIKARRRLIKALPGFWSGLPEFKLGFDILQVLEELKYSIHILTKGPAKSELAYMEKVQWIRARFKYPMTISDDKGLVYGKVLVDDWPSYITRWQEWRPRGLVIAPAQPWNKGIDSRPNVVRYDGTNLDQVRERLAARLSASFASPN